MLFRSGGAIVCPLHRSAFDLKSGKLVGPWCPAPPLIGPLTGKLKSPKELKTFQVRSQGGNVQVLLDVNAKKRFDANYWRGILDAQGKVDGGYYYARRAGRLACPGVQTPTTTRTIGHPLIVPRGTREAKGGAFPPRAMRARPMTLALCSAISFGGG